MKNWIFRSSVTALLLLALMLMLLRSSLVIDSVHAGLELWYSAVLPSIFPFMIITSLLLTQLQGSKLCLLGLVCGLPVGANLVNQQVKNGTLPNTFANPALCICNITSPMFLCGYVWNQTLHKQIPIAYLLFCIYFPMLAYGFFCYIRIYFFLQTAPHAKTHSHKTLTATSFSSGSSFDSISLKNKSYAPNLTYSQTTHSASDTGDSGFESILLHCLRVIMLVGVYIMLFCILFRFLLTLLPASSILSGILISSLEVTNGVHLLAGLPISLQQKTALIAALCSFGGICSMFQTKSVLTESELSLSHYIIIKIILGAASYLLGILIPLP